MREDDPEKFSADDSRKWIILSLVVGTAVYFISQKFMIINKATVFGIFASLTILLIRYYWRLRRVYWFWGVMAIIFSVDMGFVFLVPAGNWPNSTIILAPIAIIQLTVSVFLISNVESAIKKRR